METSKLLECELTAVDDSIGRGGLQLYLCCLGKNGDKSNENVRLVNSLHAKVFVVIFLNIFFLFVDVAPLIAVYRRWKSLFLLLRRRWEETNASVIQTLVQRYLWRSRRLPEFWSDSVDCDAIVTSLLSPLTAWRPIQISKDGHAVSWLARAGHGGVNEALCLHVRPRRFGSVTGLLRPGSGGCFFVGLSNEVMNISPASLLPRAWFFFPWHALC